MKPFPPAIQCEINHHGWYGLQHEAGGWLGNNDGCYTFETESMAQAALDWLKQKAQPHELKVMCRIFHPVGPGTKKENLRERVLLDETGKN